MTNCRLQATPVASSRDFAPSEKGPSLHDVNKCLFEPPFHQADPPSSSTTTSKSTQKLSLILHYILDLRCAFWYVVCVLAVLLLPDYFLMIWKGVKGVCSSYTLLLWIHVVRRVSVGSFQKWDSVKLDSVARGMEILLSPHQRKKMRETIVVDRCHQFFRK